ncbi:MAG: phosphoserine aminotransferase [Cyclobacteriaceae bacterium]|jgi:phosphoserine aminotransferase
MNVANFYPGPSRVYSNITEFIYEAYMEGVMSANHRSAFFMEMMSETKAILQEKLLIPADYEIAFTSSATENWEIISQSLTKKGSFHFFNGDFGKKWFEYAQKLGNAHEKAFDINEELPDELIGDGYDVICVTQNETSNGTQVSNTLLKKLKDENPDKLLAVDVTSSLGGVIINFENADYWFGSTQKCLGLPAGLGVLILSPKAVEKAFEINERNHYNSLVSLIENARKNQTAYTPNVLGIYLLNRTQKVSKGIEHLEEKCLKRLMYYDEMLQKLAGFEYLVENEAVRSKTVLTLKYDDPAKLRKDSLQFGIELGAGYGAWKSSTFRIANFPAIKTKEIAKLTSYLEGKYLRS